MIPDLQHQLNQQKNCSANGNVILLNFELAKWLLRPLKVTIMISQTCPGMRNFYNCEIQDLSGNKVQRVNNSEMVKAVNLAICSIHCTKSGISNFPVSRYWVKFRWGISHFWISGQSFLNKNCHNPRTNHDVDIKLGPVAKLDK